VLNDPTNLTDPTGFTYQEFCVQTTEFSRYFLLLGTRLFILKFLNLRIKSMKNLLIFFLAFQFLSPAIAQSTPEKSVTTGCQYNPVKIGKPSDVVSLINRNNSTFFLLKTGAYVEVTDWSCKRYGKRIFLVVPVEHDSEKYVNTILSKLIDKDILVSIKQGLRKSFSKDEFDADLGLTGYEESKISIHRTEYEAVYLITYYTPD